VFVDDELIMTIQKARTGVFRGIVYPDYPKMSPNFQGWNYKEGYMNIVESKPVCIVTGGGTGIGAACCKALSADGF